MTAPFACPWTECCQALLDDALTPNQRQPCEQHLQSCPVCQDCLDRAEVGEDRLRRLGRQVGDPTLVPADPTLSRVLDRLHEVKPPERAVAAEPLDLYFLRPADRPEVLGMLGPYEVCEVIGQGGMGVVLKAFEPALQRLVAIKVLAPALAGSSTARKRFTREAQAAAAVRHDHVVAIHGVQEADGLPYLVMEFVAGESLQQRLDRAGPLEAEEVVRIGMQTAAGLAAAHAQGLIHRDIKPANLLLEGEPEAYEPPGLSRRSSATGIRVKITDFGLARMTDDVQLTQAGVVAGTPEYMAPEQARGEAVDNRADLFSLGSVLYAMCTAAPPFRGTTALAVLSQVSQQEPAPLRSLNPDVPAWLEALTLRLLAKNPADRFQSAAEVAALLEAYLAHLRQPMAFPEPPLPLQPGSGARQPSPGGPRRWLSRTCWLLAIVVLALGPIAFLLLQAALPPAPVPLAPGGELWSVAVSQDGKLVAASAGLWDKPSETGVWNLATGEPLKRFSEEMGVASVALSPNGKLLAWGSWNGQVRVVDWAAGKQIVALPTEGVARVAFSPDGQLLATATEDLSAQLWDVAAGKLLADLEGDPLRFHCVTFSPDGKRVLAGGGDRKLNGINQVNIWDVASKAQVGKLTGHKGPILAISYSPNDKTIATGSEDRTIRLWDADSGKHLKTLAGHTGKVESVVFLADGKTVISGSQDRTIRFWDVGQGQETKQILMRSFVRVVRLTPDGKTLLAGGGLKALKIYAAESQKELTALWDESVPGQPSAMDHLPAIVLSERRAMGKLGRWGLLGLGLAFLMSVGFAVRLALQHRRGETGGRTPHTPPAKTEPGSNFLSFACAECAKSLKVEAELAGKKVKCPRCGKVTSVPEIEGSDVSMLPERIWGTRGAVLAAFGASGLIASLFVVVLWGSLGSDRPAANMLQALANRVRAQKTDSIDPRMFPTFTDQDLNMLHGLSNLRTLNLDHTGITDRGLKEVAGLTGLVSLSLTNTQVTDVGLSEIKTLTGLEELRLDRLPITDASLAILPAFPKLRKLSLFQAGITDKGLVHLEQNTSLEHLSLDDTTIGDEGLRHLSGCPNLKYISIWKSRVTPAGIQELTRALPGLKVNK